MEGDPFAVLEAMTIAGYATGTERGWLYIRGEYPRAATPAGWGFGFQHVQNRDPEA